MSDTPPPPDRLYHTRSFGLRLDEPEFARPVQDAVPSGVQSMVAPPDPIPLFVEGTIFETIGVQGVNAEGRYRYGNTGDYTEYGHIAEIGARLGWQSPVVELFVARITNLINKP